MDGVTLAGIQYDRATILVRVSLWTQGQTSAVIKDFGLSFEPVRDTIWYPDTVGLGRLRVGVGACPDCSKVGG